MPTRTGCVFPSIQACRLKTWSMCVTQSLSSTASKQLFYSVYDTIFAKKDYLAEVNSVLGLGGIGSGAARILEPGGGPGNHARCFAGAGPSVVGIDPDEEMLTIARAKLTLLPR